MCVSPPPTTVGLLAPPQLNAPVHLGVVDLVQVVQAYETDKQATQFTNLNHKLPTLGDRHATRRSRYAKVERER